MRTEKFNQRKNAMNDQPSVNWRISSTTFYNKCQRALLLAVENMTQFSTQCGHRVNEISSGHSELNVPVVNTSRVHTCSLNLAPLTNTSSSLIVLIIFDDVLPP